MTRQPLSIRTILLLTVGMLALATMLLAGHETVREWRQLQKIQSLAQAAALSDELFTATEKFSVERDITYSMLHATDENTENALRLRLEKSRPDSDKAFTIALGLLTPYGFTELTTLNEEISSRLATIRELRTAIDQPSLTASKKKELAERWYDEATILTQQIEGLWMQFTRHFTDVNPIVTQHLRFKHFLRIIIDYTGRQRSIIGRLLVENADATAQESADLLRGQGTLELSWKISGMLAEQSGLLPTISSPYTDAKSHYMTMMDMIKDIFYVPGARHGVSYPIDINLWFELSDQASESLDTLKEATLKETQRFVKALEQQARQAITIHVLLFSGALFLCIYSFVLIIRRVMNPINAMVNALVSTMEGQHVTITVPSERHDEIGKLAQVLQAFQYNLQAIQKTSAELESHAQALEHSNKELDDFAYIASHDLKEPLRGIHNHSRFLLEDNQDKLDAESVRKLNRLVYLSQRMERLVNDLLYFSRLGRQELAIKSTDINEVIDDIRDTLDIFLTERNAQITIPVPLPTIICDAPRISELFRNLITNAVKYNDKAEKIVEIGFRHAQHHLHENRIYKNVFYVRDNGKGIPEEFHEEIFRIFKRLQSSKDTAEEGTGVGLTFVKKIIERHEGRIWLESAIDSGTTFYFTLAPHEKEIHS